MIWIQKHPNIHHDWGVFIFGAEWRKCSFELCIKLSPYYRIYVRRRETSLVKRGLGRWVVEPGWVDSWAEGTVYHPSGIQHGVFCYGWLPRPSWITKMISYVVIPIRKVLKEQEHYLHVSCPVALRPSCCAKVEHINHTCND